MVRGVEFNFLCSHSRKECVAEDPIGHDGREEDAKSDAPESQGDALLLSTCKKTGAGDQATDRGDATEGGPPDERSWDWSKQEWDEPRQDDDGKGGSFSEADEVAEPF